MIICKVAGSIVATRKNEKLIGSKFMVVEPLDIRNEYGKSLIAVDQVGAGIGEVVLVALGSAARIGCDTPDSPIDAAIIGIVDQVNGLE